MLISILILVVSLAALIQFAAFTWRAAFLTVATADLPEDLAKHITLNDFKEASAYERLCPELGIRVSTRLGSVSAYNAFLQFAISIGDAILPSAAHFFIPGHCRQSSNCPKRSFACLSR